MRTAKKALLFTGASMAMLVVIIFGASQAPAAAQKGVMKGAIHFGVSADWFDPSISGNSATSDLVVRMFHDSLLKPMPGELYSPCLAESWNVSPDKKVYEFNLRKGVKFHNGEEVTAEDVLFTFKRDTTSGPIRDKIQKMEAVNTYLFRVIFKEPVPEFLEYFLQGVSKIGWVVPKKYIEKVGDKEYRKNPIGCGPYRFVEFTPGVRLVGEAFEGFWRKVPKVKRLELYFIREKATRYAMVKKGEVDFSLSMVDIFYKKVKEDPALTLFTGESATHWIMNMTRQFDPNSPWSNRLVRKAASLALDRQSLADIHYPGAGPIGSIGLPGDPDVLPGVPDTYDPVKAKQLMAEAGYPNGFNGGPFYPFGGTHVEFAEQIANYWKAIGIDLEFIPIERVAWYAKRRGGKMKNSTFNDPVVSPTIRGRLNNLIGSGPQTYGNYPDIQALWDQYNQSFDSKVRKDLITRIQKLIREKVMFIYVIGASTPSAFGPRVTKDPRWEAW